MQGPMPVTCLDDAQYPALIEDLDLDFDTIDRSTGERKRLSRLCVEGAMRYKSNEALGVLGT